MAKPKKNTQTWAITYADMVTLLLTFFNNHPFNQLIENGHLYIAKPPLFRISKENKSYYAQDEIEKDKIDEKIKNKIKKHVEKKHKNN